MAPSLTSRGPAGLVVLVVLDLDLAARAGLVGLDLAGPVDPVVLDLAARAGLVGLDRVGPVGLVDPAVLGPVGRVGLADPAHIRDRADPVGLVVLGRVGPVDPAVLAVLGLVDPAVLGLVVLDLAGPVGLAVPVDPAVLGPVGRVGLADPAHIRDRADPVGLDRAGPVGLVVLDLAGRVDLADRVVRADPAVLGQVDRVDHHRRRTRPGVLMTEVAPRWAAPTMRRTASARQATVRRLRPRSTDSAGMAGLLPERHRQTGTDRRLPADGTVLRLRVVGTARGMGRRATSV